jgi:hypothetical protein
MCLIAPREQYHSGLKFFVTNLAPPLLSAIKIKPSPIKRGTTICLSRRILFSQRALADKVCNCCCAEYFIHSRAVLSAALSEVDIELWHLVNESTLITHLSRSTLASLFLESYRSNCFTCCLIGDFPRASTLILVNRFKKFFEIRHTRNLYAVKDKEIQTCKIKIN